MYLTIIDVPAHRWTSSILVDLARFGLLNFFEHLTIIDVPARRWTSLFPVVLAYNCYPVSVFVYSAVHSFYFVGPALPGPAFGKTVVLENIFLCVPPLPAFSPGGLEFFSIPLEKFILISFSFRLRLPSRSFRVPRVRKLIFHYLLILILVFFYLETIGTLFIII